MGKAATGTARANGRSAKRVKGAQQLPGMESPRIKALDDAATNYYDVMMERCKLSKEEDEKKTALIEKMKANQLKRYETQEGLVVTVTEKSNCKVKHKSRPDAEGEE